MQVQRQIDELLAHRASEWLELLPTASEAERKEFAEWLSESRLHVQAFLEIAEIEYSLHGIDRERREDLNLILSRIVPNVVPLGRPPPPPAQSESTPARSRLLGWRAKVTAGVLAAASLAAIALLVAHSRASQFSTAIGEQRTVELADTSVVTLNALSKIEVHLAEMERDIELRQGEALFTVAHDTSRPFKVRTRAGVVQAVGTQFNVYDKPNGDTRVSVLQGRVRLIPRGSEGNEDSGSSELLEAGEEADIRLDGKIQRNASAVVANTVAWRQRRLVFDNATLEDMVVEFNRYNPALRLELDGVPAGTYRYNGIFDAADPQSFVDLLSREQDLTVERRGSEVVVRPKVP